MSFVIAVPEVVSVAAVEVARIGLSIGAANSAAAAATTDVLAAAGDEVSAAIAALFGAQGQQY